MSDTPILGLPYLAAAQAQKHVTHNEALTILDILVQASAKSRHEASPPATPANGDRYLVPSGASAEWATATGKLAVFSDGGWRFHAPREGWRLWIDDEDKLIVYDGSAWHATGGEAPPPPPPPPPPETLDHLGIHATADPTNRFVVSSAATLLNHEGEGHQLKVNKAKATDTASLLFQTGFSGRAEMGVVGNDDFKIKVSADGATFKEALSAEAATGVITAHQSLRLAPREADPATPIDGEIWYSAASKTLRKRQNGVSMDLVPATSGGGPGNAANVNVVTASLPADVTMAQLNNFYECAKVDIGPGTWLVFALAHFMRMSPNASIVSVRLTDDTTVFGTISASIPSTTGWITPFPLTTVVTATSPIALKLQMAVTLGVSAVMKAVFPVNGSNSRATTLTAVRIA
ncbi:MAG: DUF2793 domain-containing protein [Rhizobiales bacterium]|nr:DUF2793 domain-containing protein [Hyphomicrobiales bacterium]